MESTDLYSKALRIIVDFIVEICGNKHGLSSEQKALAKEALNLIIKNRVEITEQLLEKLRTFQSKLHQGIESAYKELKAIIQEVLTVECWEATTGFIGRLGEFVKHFVCNCVLCCSERITIKELVSQTRSSVDDLMRPSAEPLKYAGIGTGIGVVTGAVIPVAGTIIGGVVGAMGGFIVGSIIGVAVARKNEKSKKLN